MRKVCALLTAALLALLCACAPESGETGGLRLWFAIPGVQQTVQAVSALDTCAYQGEETVPALMEALLSGPGEDEIGLVSPIPAEVELLGWAMDGRVAEVELSAAYGGLSGIDRTLADYCVTLTLTQLGWVDGVRILCGRGWEDYRVLRTGDVVFSGAEEEPVDVPATLYFRRTGSGALGAELRVFRLTEDEAPAKAVLEALVRGPEDAGLEGLLPPGLTVLSAGLADGVCYANLSAVFLEEIPSGRAEQELLVSSIVETLCSLDQVDGVQILVEGQLLERYGDLTLAGPLRPGE